VIRVAEQMPLADERRLVAGSLEEFGDVRLRTVEAIEHRHAVLVAVLAGKNRRAARGANRIDDETIREPHSGGGDAVEVWRLVDFASVTTQRVRRVVIGENEEDVRPFCRGLRGSRGEESRRQSQDQRAEPANERAGARPFHASDA